ncbi:hypothetical protein R6Q59_021131 [Mikania micrantha]
MELKENSEPFRWKDKRYWKSIPHVIGPDGRPMPRKAIKTKKESDDKLSDFARQFFYGLCSHAANAHSKALPLRRPKNCDLIAKCSMVGEDNT